MIKTTTAYPTWHTDPNNDAAMVLSHAPLWRHFIEMVPVQDYAPDDFIRAFSAAGFDVSLRRFGYDGFTPAGKDRRYYSSVFDALAYPAEHKLLFRPEKRA